LGKILVELKIEDNSSIASSYTVNVTDGVTNVGPSFPNINFSIDTTGLPVITINPKVIL
jgi:hypothetical protein